MVRISEVCRACLLLSLVSPAQVAADPFRFISIGDWGTGGRNQKRVAKVLGETAERVRPEFVLSLGDNMYYFGAKSAEDPKWQHRFERVYHHPALQVPWCAVAGNHDWAGDSVQAQVDYHKKNEAGRWYMPGLYYTRTWDVGDGRTLQVVFIDTVLLAPQQFLKGVDQVLRRLLYGRRRGEQLARLTSQGEEQMRWLNATLEESAADWLLVAGHYPVYSAGHHGDSPEMSGTLRPLLEQHGVTAYLCGHDHSLQHLEGNGVAYLVSGSGGAATTKVKRTAERRFAAKESGFMVHEVEGDVMRVSVIGGKGAVIYSTELRARTSRRREKQEEENEEPAGMVVEMEVEGGGLVETS